MQRLHGRRRRGSRQAHRAGAAPRRRNTATEPQSGGRPTRCSAPDIEEYSGLRAPLPHIAAARSGRVLHTLARSRRRHPPDPFGGADPRPLPAVAHHRDGRHRPRGEAAGRGRGHLQRRGRRDPLCRLRREAKVPPIPARPHDIDYFAPIGHFANYSDRRHHGRQARPGSQDKLVLVAATAQGTFDQRVTPLDKITAGVEVHANAIETILSQRYLRARPAGADGGDRGADPAGARVSPSSSRG